MAVENVIESWEGREFSTGVDDSHDERIFTVLFDGEDTIHKQLYQACKHDDIPKKYQSHPVKPGMYVKNVSARMTGPQSAEVRAFYGTAGARGGEEAPYENLDDALSQPATWSWHGRQTTEQVDRDINGDPITNSSDESPDAPLTRPFSDRHLVIVRNEASFDAQVADSYCETVNADAFCGWPAGTALCIEISAEACWQGPQLYYKVTYEFLFRMDGWKGRFLDQGYRVKDATSASGYKAITIENDDGEQVPIQKPMNLDGEGNLLPDGDDPVWIEPELFATSVFANLGL